MMPPLPSPLAPPPPGAGPMLPPDAGPMPGTPLPMPPGAGPPPPGVGGIPGAMGSPPPLPPSSNDPASAQYTTETQQNGTVLIRLLNADGSPGPVVHIWEPPALKKGAK